MAPRKRDYKAEYQRSKQRAKAAGYQSERSYKSAKRELGLSGRVSPLPPARVEPVIAERREAREWAKAHSRKPSTQFDPHWSNEKIDKYRAAFVDPPEGRNRRERARDRARKIKDFLGISDKEWETNYAQLAAIYNG